MKIELFCVPKILGAIPVNCINISVDHYPNNIHLMATEYYRFEKERKKKKASLKVEHFTNF